jgi:hypothetical protein
VFEAGGPALWRRVTRQVGQFLGELEAQGALAGAAQSLPAAPGSPVAPGSLWFVLCDERLNPPAQPAGQLSFLFGVAAHREGEWQSFLVTQTPAGGEVRTVTLNRLQSAGGHLPLDPDLDVATLLADRWLHLPTRATET